MLAILRCERGVSLPAVLGVLMVLTISVLGIIEYTAANSRNASLSFARQDSRGIAEDGLNRAAAILATDPASAPGGVIPACGAGGLPATPSVGQASWCGIRTGPVDGIFTWTLKSTGSARNPTGPAASPQRHTVSAQFTVQQGMGAWEFVYIEPAGTDCMDMKNDFVLHSPLYVKGNLCLQNEARYQGPRLYVTGTVQIKDNARIGTNADGTLCEAGVCVPARIPRVSVRNNAPAASGCRFPWSGSYVLPCGDTQKVFATAFDNEVPPVQRPPVDFPYWYENAKPGPRNACTTYSGPSAWSGTSFFDNNTTRNNSNADRDLMPSSQSYNCEFREGTTLVGRIGWDHTTHVFTIHGTVFFDGKILLNNNTGLSGGAGGIRYEGRGTIYANDIIKISTDVRVCAVTVSCREATWNASTDTWNPNIAGAPLLFMIAGNTSANAIEIENGARYQGGLYSSGGINVKSGSPGAQVQGPIVALGAEVQNGADLRPWPWFSDLPDGVPSYGTPHLAFKPGSWRG
jgi:Tfp pilus assembly protein PilX